MSQKAAQLVIAQLGDELLTLIANQTATLKRIAIVKRTLVGLTKMYSPDLLSNNIQVLLSLQVANRHRFGLTEACRQLLYSKTGTAFTIGQITIWIREEYPELLVDNDSLGNSVRTILGRMVRCGLAARSMTKGGRIAWLAVVGQTPSNNPAASVSTETDERHTGTL
jgi:hypothetical protein